MSVRTTPPAQADADTNANANADADRSGVSALAGAVLSGDGTQPTVHSGSGGGALQIRDGYFWDPQTQSYFIPRGIAYQTWNPPVFAFQSFEQLRYDLREFKKMHCNSVRAEFVWGEVEVADDVYDWSKPDFLVATAEELGLKLFVLIGFQYPPSWFPEEWRGTNDRGERSDVLNYEDERGRKVYREHMARVAERYKDSTAIGGWILGNEFAYFDLWESPQLYPARRFLGFDPISIASYREYLRSVYDDDIARLNAVWASDHTGFDSVPMSLAYPADRHDPGYHDLIQWRQQSIGDFVASGAAEVRRVDPNHLITYSMVGGIFNPTDTNNTCEDPLTIVEKCAAVGAPMDFWSINNYSWASVGSDVRSSDFGATKYQDLLDIPIFVSELGHSSTDDLIIGAAPRQADAIPSQLWESLMSGLVGVHVFHWNDRNQFTEDFFLRERGFGIMNATRTPKLPVYDNVRRTFRRMEELRIDDLLGGSRGPSKDVQMFWSRATDMGWPRANQENAKMWQSLKRLGYQPGLIDDALFDAGAYADAPVLMLSRGYQLYPRHLDALAERVIPAGIHVHASSDLPGEFNAYHQPNPDWEAQMDALFGLDVRNATPAWDGGVRPDLGLYRPITLRGSGVFGDLTPGYRADIVTWKIWHGIQATAGRTLLTHTGDGNSQPPMPAIHTLDLGTAKTAVNTFGLADTHGGDGKMSWDVRYELLKAIYRDHFGIQPAITFTGPGSRYVVSDYRLCGNETILVSLQNLNIEPADLTVRAPTLMEGKTIENLISGGIVETDSDGTISVPLEPDEFALFYIYDRTGESDQSLVQGNANKLWITSAPMLVWPSPAPTTLQVGHDVVRAGLSLAASLESTEGPRRVRGRSQRVAVPTGKGSTTLQLVIDDPDLNDGSYRSTVDGAGFFWRIWLEAEGVRISETRLPVRLAWGAVPEALPETVNPGESHSIRVIWQELPSRTSGNPAIPLERARLWDSKNATAEHYNIVLELHGAAGLIESKTHVTREGSSSHEFEITVPVSSRGPFEWRTYAETAPMEGISRDIHDGFEGRDTGAYLEFPNPDDPTEVVFNDHLDLISPWNLQTYAESPDAGDLYQNHGVHSMASEGSQSAFFVITNSAATGAFSGFFLQREFPDPVVLPDEPSDRAGYLAGFDFREAEQFAATLEIQVKDSSGGLIHWIKPYEPGPDGWDTIEATLDQFVIPPWYFGTFDPADVTEILFLVQMNEQERQYVASIDRLRYDGPDVVQRGGDTLAAYTSRDDSPRDRDQDGVPDPFESGTGVYVSRENTGTDPDQSDSDGDGYSDGAELEAGTDPNRADDRLEISGIQVIDETGVEIQWNAVAGRIYAAEFAEPGAVAGSVNRRSPLVFRGFNPIIEVLATESGPMRLRLPLSPRSNVSVSESGSSWYRLSVRRRSE